MPTPQSASTSQAPSGGRQSSRASSKARNELLTQLKDDHQRVKKAYAKYRRLDMHEDAEARQELLQLVLDELSVHAQLEEELLYPAARDALEDESQIEEAEVEHEMLHILIDQLRDLDPEDDTHLQEQHARFTVLCEYTLHHVKEEEREMFPQLMKARLDWQTMAQDFEERRAELKGETDEGEDDDGTLDAGPEDESMDEDEAAEDQDEDSAPEALEASSEAAAKSGSAKTGQRRRPASR